MSNNNIIACDVPIADVACGLVGTPDLLLRLIDGRTMLVDLKRTKPDVVVAATRAGRVGSLAARDLTNCRSSHCNVQLLLYACLVLINNPSIAINSVAVLRVHRDQKEFDADRVRCRCAADAASRATRRAARRCSATRVACSSARDALSSADSRGAARSSARTARRRRTEYGLRVVAVALRLVRPIQVLRNRARLRPSVVGRAAEIGHVLRAHSTLPLDE